MKETLYLKFSQHRGLVESLLATGDHQLVSQDTDAYWGVGRDGTGENRLGSFLLELREYLNIDQIKKAFGNLYDKKLVLPPVDVARILKILQQKSD